MNDFVALAAKWAREGIEAPPLLGIQEHDLGPGVSLIEIVTTNGIIVCIRRLPPGVEPGTPVPFTTFFLGGAIGGLSGTNGLYHHLAMKYGGVSIHYRLASRLDECLIDVMCVYHHLSKTTGLERVALVGHSFGGGVVCGAGVLLGPATAGVVGLASQLVGSELVARMEGTPILLIHGGADQHLSPSLSRHIYERAKEPKELLILPGEGHGLSTAGEVLEEKIGAFIERVREPA